MQSVSLEGYEIIEEIGRGGMGIVFKGHDLALDRPVAIKIFNKSALSAEASLRAQREAQALARIKHENLISVYALDKDSEGNLALVSDFIAGKPLSDYIKNTPLPTADAIGLFRQLCLGLSALHSAGVIHRDIKPGNLMVSEIPSGKHLTIIDFGLAKLADMTQQRLTTTGLVMGTPAYMSPEQFQASPDITPATDLYSAACVAYEMLTGNRPFDEESPYLVADAHLHQPTPSVKDRVETPYLAAIDSFFNRAMAKEATDRFENAEAMFDGFRNAVEKGTVLGGIARQKKAPPPFSESRRKFIVAAVAVTLIVGIAVLIFGNAQKNDTAELTRSQVDDQVRATYNKGEALIHVGRHKDARLFWKQEISRLESCGATGPDMAMLYIAYAKQAAIPWANEDHNKNYPEDAVAAAEKGVAISKQLNRPLREPYQRLGLCYVMNSQYAKAFEISKEIWRLEGTPVKDGIKDWYSDLPHTLMRLWMPEHVVRCPLQGKPEDGFIPKERIPAQRAVARAFIALKQYDKAIALLKQNIPSFGNDDKHIDHIELALAYALSKRPNQSERELKILENHLDSKREALLPVIEVCNEFARGKSEAAHNHMDKIMQDTESFVAMNYDRPCDMRERKFAAFRNYKILEQVAEDHGLNSIADKCRAGQKKLHIELAKEGGMLPPGADPWL